jgi:hypothetical protein
VAAVSTQSNGRHRRPALALALPPRQALDELLLRLRVHGLHYAPDPQDVNEWTATCALCRGHDALTLRETDDGRLTLRCANGCDPKRVVAFVKCAPSDVLLAQRDAWVDELRELAREAIALARNLARQVSVLEGTIDRALGG